MYRNYIWKYSRVLFGKHRANCLFFTLTSNLKLQTNTLKLSKPAIFNKITKFYSHPHPLTHLHHRSPVCPLFLSLLPLVITKLSQGMMSSMRRSLSDSRVHLDSCSDNPCKMKHPSSGSEICPVGTVKTPCTAPGLTGSSGFSQPVRLGRLGPKQAEALEMAK